MKRCKFCCAQLDVSDRPLCCGECFREDHDIEDISNRLDRIANAINEILKGMK